jgi:hypothetical protein
VGLEGHVLWRAGLKTFFFVRAVVTVNRRYRPAREVRLQQIDPCNMHTICIHALSSNLANSELPNLTSTKLHRSPRKWISEKWKQTHQHESQLAAKATAGDERF